MDNILTDSNINNEGILVRRALNPATGAEYEKCKYALFASCRLGAFEPEIVVKLYDSLRFQKEDTGIMIMCCGFAAKRDGAPGWKDTFDESLRAVKSAWESLGEPVLICPCPTCMKTLGEALPEIPTVSLYEKLNEYGINGGCNSVEYYLWEAGPDGGLSEAGNSAGDPDGDGCDSAGSPDCDPGCDGCGTAGDPDCGGCGTACGPDGDAGYIEHVRLLAENMGVKFQPAPADPADAEYPYITCNINIRNMLKSRGCDAAHILELIYGMGDSNTHLIHEHDHGDGAGASGSDGGTETADTAGAGPIGAACNRASGPADYDGASDSADRDGADSIDCDGLSGQADCDGDCTSCSLCAGCTYKPQPPAPLPDAEQQNRNRAELKEALLALFW